MLSPTRFRFLNVEGDLRQAADWNRSESPKLWIYNLHYFDDLNAAGNESRVKWHRELMARWVAENPPGMGAGWEPYTLSLRIVNWVKWALAGNALDDDVRESLAVQARFLTERLERHLLGNHLFANAKALVFAGCFFDGDEASEWRRIGMEILAREIPEQILPDGGHFERSTMYQALAYEDMLDLANLAGVFPDAFRPWLMLLLAWPDLIKKMGGWLRAMCHPDGKIAFFNDAAIGIAPPPGALFDYADRLGFPADTFDTFGITWLRESGYVRIRCGEAVLLIDVAPIGPDYLPGHAHADSLSFELSLRGQRIIVNSGTSCYGLGPDREWERSTAAHSTLEIDGQNSSEVWGGFRVARRAYPCEISVTQKGVVFCVSASHDGYRWLRDSPIHRRSWELGNHGLTIRDMVVGRHQAAVARFYLHPSVELTREQASGSMRWDKSAITWQANDEGVEMKTSYYAPEFGLRAENACLELTARDGQSVLHLNW